ncbi:phosphoribosylformylglycinamidine synthase-associated small membrane protein [Labrenzia sp. VG12]|nr:phosphoribosylformylglycinamidine synthase-associated small membrane protein [Labrenzia sp. VG12]ASP33424.1 phosphoribosylformylglycinamidine synthase [Labrenzia sp. VG12]
MDEDARKAVTFLALKAAIFILVPALAALLAVFFLL